MKDLSMSEYSTVIVWADFMAPGLWIPNPTPGFAHSSLAIEHESLNIPKVLSDKINKWISSYWGVYDHPESFDCDRFNCTGVMLASELQFFLGPPHKSGTLVLFRPEIFRTLEEMKKYYGNNKDED